MNSIKRKMTLTFIIMLLLSIVVLFSGCGNDELKSVSSIDQLNGKVIGCPTGSVYSDEIRGIYPNSPILEYNSYADMISALKTGRIDTYIADEPLVMSHLSEIDGIEKLDSFITKARYGFMLNQDDEELCLQINSVISKFKQSGELERLRKKWIGVSVAPEIEIPQKWDKSKGTLEIGLIPESDPFAFYVDGKFIGYDVELMYMIAAELGYDINITPYDFNSVISSLMSKRSDIIIGCITYSEERAQSVLFTDSTYDSGVVAVIRSDYNERGFLTRLERSFERTFIFEQRWKMIVNGLLVTVELSLLTLVAGSLLGFGFSFWLRSKYKLLNSIAKALSTIIDGLPILIVLMVLYYIVFVNTSLPAVIIGIIGLSIDFANTVAGIMNSGVNAVPKGEIEAAYSMGYSRWKTYIKIVFPQAVNHIFAQYTSSIISMIKGTSVIGYITVMDLTKAGDIIRSRTYEAFFPLVAIALIYFVIARLFVAILQLLSKRINPKHRKRIVKGVQIND